MLLLLQFSFLIICFNKYKIMDIYGNRLTTWYKANLRNHNRPSAFICMGTAFRYFKFEIVRLNLALFQTISSNLAKPLI